MRSEAEQSVERQVKKLYVVEWKHEAWGWYPLLDTVAESEPYAIRAMSKQKEKEPSYEYRIATYIRTI